MCDLDPEKAKEIAERHECWAIPGARLPSSREWNERLTEALQEAYQRGRDYGVKSMTYPPPFPDQDE